MAIEILIKSIDDPRGSLSVIENQLDFSIKRVFYIYNVPSQLSRGGHAHKKTKMALVCVGGYCTITVISPKKGKQEFHLDDPHKCLILKPEDWHQMSNFSDNATLLVLASEKYDANDYVLEKPE